MIGGLNLENIDKLAIQCTTLFNSVLSFEDVNECCPEDEDYLGKEELQHY